MKTIKIEGMHCEACQKLIRMELEEAGFSGAIKEFRQVEKNLGELNLTDTTDEESVKKIIEIIGNMDDYKVS